MLLACKDKLSLISIVARRIPSLNWLRVFEAAARTGSFARAAERLAMSPPAVSQQIRALETHLGKTLFDRAAAGVSLTEAGRGLLEGVGEPLGRMEAAAEAMSSSRKPPLVVGVSLTLLSGWLAPRLPSFQAAHPKVPIAFLSLIGRHEIAMRRAALWIAFGPHPPGTEARVLFGERLFPVARPDLAGRLATPADFFDHLLIEVSDHRRNWAQILGADLLPQRTRVVQVDTTLAALSLSAAGAGVALARAPASDALVKRLGLVPCTSGMSIRGVEDYRIVHPSGARLGTDAAAFRDWVAGEAQRTRAEQDL